ncbi:MAG: DNA translocase FtsK [bacterium]|nr:DNA translocase FtsK [bacterium]
MKKENGRAEKNKETIERHSDGERLHPDTKKSIWAIAFFGLAVIFVLAAFGKAGPLGGLLHGAFQTLFGAGYFILPTSLVFAAAVLLLTERQRVVGVTLLGAALIILSFLGLIELVAAGQGGWLGFVLGSLRVPFGQTAAIIVNVLLFFIGALIASNIPIKIRRLKEILSADKRDKLSITGVEGKDVPKKLIDKKSAEENVEEEEKNESEIGERELLPKKTAAVIKQKKPALLKFVNYVPPPLELLKSMGEKPTTGDLLANANIIKRTLDSFGIPVEMGEINVGPSVTRYTLKPAEGVKLSRITALNQDLALALAAHPIRIEAPIPGKSLVGIEVPNKAAALVRLGSLMGYPEFQKSGPLGFVLGRDVSGEPVFADIEKMPHMLVAGATGSGKSILIHSLLISLIYKNSPATLKLILVDPKRVELSIYQGLPHLVSPVIIESKKAVGVFRWAINEMERRYDVLLKAGSRDIKSYNSSNPEEPLPFLLIVVDELADLMTSYGREVEGSIVRLAQMARATGLHLILSTQRPSVEVITGLIKANITSRIALQVASQIDSRTILDTSGAEKLLGRGDLLYVSSDLSKPKRIQSSYITEEEINKVTDFIREHNKGVVEETEAVSFDNVNGNAPAGFNDYLEDNDDELYAEAIDVVREAKKASASLLQRRLSVGYARAARLLDLMEADGVIGPGDGAKPRDVFLEKIEGRRIES